MGLAEPRKRLKIAHDPRNLHWSSTDSTQSFGKRLMQRQGWEQGQSLGARPTSSHASQKAAATTELDTGRLAASKVGVVIKDNTLGLGAQLKSKDLQHQKTGLDAFQGLLGRLNGKSDEEVRIVARKGEERRLEMYARGRWGGMVFVRGGVLVQGEEFKKKTDAEKIFKEGIKPVEVVGDEAEVVAVPVEEDDERKRRKEEKRVRKEQRRARKAAEAISQTATFAEEGISNRQIHSTKTFSVSAPNEAKSSSEEEITATTEQPRKRRGSSINAEEAIKKQLLPLKNGRHLLRGKNIEAKRKAFSDMKGLDAIFMRT